MRRHFLLAAAGALAIASSAFAAEPLPPPVPIFTWSGIYIGGQLGGAWGHDNVTWSGIANDGDLAGGSFGHSLAGVIGGAHVGFNLQVNPWLVLGAEGTVDGTSLSNTIAVPVNDFAGDTPGVITATNQAEVQGSIRGRIGLAFDRALIYGTGGVAFTGFKTVLVDTTGFFTGLPEPIRPSRIRVSAGPRAEAPSMPSPTIGRCGSNTAIWISAVSPNLHWPANCRSQTASSRCDTI
jgi:outer membrane immunogenic protein